MTEKQTALSYQHAKLVLHRDMQRIASKILSDNLDIKFDKQGVARLTAMTFAQTIDHIVAQSGKPNTLVDEYNQLARAINLLTQEEEKANAHLYPGNTTE